MVTHDITIHQLLETIITVVSRRSSDNFAVIILGNALLELQKTYPFLNFIESKSTQYFEAEKITTIDEKINKIPSDQIAPALRELIEMITIALGRDAGFFFIRELKDQMGWETFNALKKIDVDLDMLQYSFSFDRIQKLAKQIDAAEILKKLLKSSIDISKQAISYRFAISTIDSILTEYSQQYKFLQYITIYDIRFTQGSDEVIVNKKINDIPTQQLAESVEKILIDINKSLEEQGYFAFVTELNRLLGSEYRVKMDDLGFNITIQQFGLQVIIKTVLQTSLQIMNEFTIHKTPNNLLKITVDAVKERHKFLDKIIINTSSSDTSNSIEINESLHDVSGLEAGRALKLILRKLLQQIDTHNGLVFIKQLRETLDPSFIVKLELMGLNLYMLQLRQELVANK